MKSYILIFLFCFVSKGNAQNLVPNSSFETYTMCPNNFGQITNAIGWNYIQAAQSADYYNSCATGTNVSVPNFFFVQITSFQELEMDMLESRL